MAPAAGFVRSSSPRWHERRVAPVLVSRQRALAFFADRRLKTIDVLTGAVRVIAMLPTSGRVLGGSWSRTGDILFAVPDDGLYLVPSARATPRRIEWSGAACEGCVAWPAFLPDGRHFLYTVVSAEPDSAGVYIGELGTTKRQRLIDVMSSCIYAGPGFLVYAESATLYAQPFDAAQAAPGRRPHSDCRRRGLQPANRARAVRRVRYRCTCLP